MPKKPSHKYQIAELLKIDAISLQGQEFTGGYLALLAAINPELIGDEAARTPELVTELGRLVAAAYRELERAKLDYRHWREQRVWEVTNDIAEAIRQGFACAKDPGVDAKGKDKPPKYPSVTAAEAWTRTLPEYMTHNELIQQREEAWATLHLTLEAAKQRVWLFPVMAKEVGDNYFPREATGPQGLNESSEGGPERPKAGRTTPPPPPKVTK